MKAVSAISVAPLIASAVALPGNSILPALKSELTLRLDHPGFPLKMADILRGRAR